MAYYFLIGVTYILNSGDTVISLESVKLGTSNFVCWLILRSTIASMIPPKGMCSGSLVIMSRKRCKTETQLQWKT